MIITIVDAICPKPYTLKTLEESTLGGTEATCIRLCRELVKRDKVNLLQHNQHQDFIEDGIHYVANGQVPVDSQVCITLRDGGLYRAVSQEFPNMKHYLWMHDVIGGKYKDWLLETLTDIPVTFIVGSMWQYNQLVQGFGDKFDSKRWGVRLLPNFIESYCVRTYEPYDPYQLIFTSSPHKGLDHVLTIFGKLRKKDSRYRLKVANPGYFESIKEVPEGVENLRILTHRKLMEHVSKSLCLFYPNTTFPETFGLVYAEANAVGTPVIAHDIGAALEIVSTPHQILDCNNHDLVIDTVMKWSSGQRPVVKCKETYTIPEAIKEWRKFLNPMRLL